MPPGGIDLKDILWWPGGGWYIPNSYWHRDWPPTKMCSILLQTAAAHGAWRWQRLRPPGFARSRGGAARHLKQSGCCGDDGVVKIKVCRPNGPA
eukprot:scaffold13315_cov115-Isochrysis_galbana.AAC.11